MEIESWEHAIDLTIARHQAVLDGKYKSYSESVQNLASKYWPFECPLCQYTYQIYGQINCSVCPWMRFTGAKCMFNKLYNYSDDEESIERLRKWKERLKEV